MSHYELKHSKTHISEKHWNPNQTSKKWKLMKDFAFDILNRSLKYTHIELGEKINDSEGAAYWCSCAAFVVVVGKDNRLVDTVGGIHLNKIEIKEKSSLWEQ